MTPLRQRMSEDMQVRNLAPHTQRSYLQQVSQFARHFGKSPDLLGPDDIRAYQLHLTRDRHLSASSILVAVAAIRLRRAVRWVMRQPLSDYRCAVPMRPSASLPRAQGTAAPGQNFLPLPYGHGSLRLFDGM